MDQPDQNTDLVLVEAEGEAQHVPGGAVAPPRLRREPGRGGRQTPLVDIGRVGDLQRSEDSGHNSVLGDLILHFIILY